MQRFTRSLLLIGSAALLGACATAEPQDLDPSEVSEASAELNGQFSIADTECNSQLTKITNAMNRARSQLTGGYLLKCLVNGFVSMDLPYNNLTMTGNWAQQWTPELLVKDLAADMPTRIYALRRNPGRVISAG